MNLNLQVRQRQQRQRQQVQTLNNMISLYYYIKKLISIEVINMMNYKLPTMAKEYFF